MRRWCWVVLPILLLPWAASLAAQTAAIAPADNLVVEHIPGIPASLAAAVDRYTNFRRAGLSSWHPTKREMLIGTRFADTTQVHHVKFPGGDRTQLTFFRDGVSGASYHPAGGAGQTITAPMPGKVTHVAVALGDQVKRGDTVVVIEAMKMENEFKAAAAGTVTEIRVRPGQAVNAGDVLVVLGQLVRSP